MQEKNFQVLFSKWLGHYGETGAYELKLTKKNTISFLVLAEHQERNLLMAKHKVMHHKIPDLGNQNPFDCFCLKGTVAYVVVQFYKRGEKRFVMIDIDQWVKERDSGKKSLSFERACEIGILKSLGPTP